MNFKYMCSGLLLCLRSDRSEFMALFVVFNLWIGPGYFFVLQSIFKFSTAIFLLRTVDQISSQVRILRSYCFYGAQ